MSSDEELSSGEGTSHREHSVLTPCFKEQVKEPFTEMMEMGGVWVGALPG